MPNEENMQNSPEINTYGSGDGVKITNGPNNVDQQPSHGEGNPKYKNMGSNNPSRPREEGDTNRGMSDNDYRNPEIRTNSYYGPVNASEGLTAALGDAPNGNPPPDGFDTWKDYQQDQKDKKAYDQLERELKDADKGKDNDLKQEQPENKTLWTPGEITKIQDLTAQSLRARQEKIAHEEKQRLQDTLNPENRQPDTSQELRNMLAKEGLKRQEDFANDVQKERLHGDAIASNIKAQDELQRQLREATNPDITDPNPELTELKSSISNMEAQIAELSAQVKLLLEKLNEPIPEVVRPQEPDITPEVDGTSDSDDQESTIIPVSASQELRVIPGDSHDIIDGEFVEIANQDGQGETLSTPEQERRDRNIKRNVMLAGFIAGAGAVIVGGTAVVPVAGGIIIGAQAVTWGTKKFSEWRERKLTDKYYATSNEQERGKIMERINKWEKVRKATEVVKRFFRGASYGVLAGSFVSGVFMGGEGVIDKIAHARAASAENFSQVSAGVHANSAPTTPTPGTPTAPAPMTPTPEIPTEGVLVQNGHVDLPGSAWNGNLAGQAQPNLDMLNHSSYTGGIHEMAPRMLENDLIANGITRDTLLNNLGERGVHSLLNNYLETIRAGVTDPNLVDVLNSMGSEGAKNIVNTIVSPN